MSLFFLDRGFGSLGAICVGQRRVARSGASGRGRQRRRVRLDLVAAAKGRRRKFPLIDRAVAL
jgi:hypothetical protein